MSEESPVKSLVRNREVNGLDCWDFICECGFYSEGWPSKETVNKRKAQHETEHETGEPAPEKGELLKGDDVGKAADLADLLELKRRS